MKKISLSKIAAGILVSALVFSGCSSSSSNSEIIASYEGKAVDGYIVNALVYHEGYKSEARVTDANGEFSLRQRETKIILEPIYDDEGNCLTIDISTGKPFTKVISAPHDYGIVTPLTTVLAETDMSVSDLASSMGLDAEQADTMLRLDPVRVMNSPEEYNATQREEASRIFTQGVVLESQLSILLSDTDVFDGNTTETQLDDKGIVLQSLFDTILDRENVNFSNLSSDDISSAYSTARVIRNENVDLSSNQARTANQIISEVVSELNNGLETVNYAEENAGYNLAVEVGKSTAQISEVTTKLLESEPTSVDNEVQNMLDAVAYESDAAVASANAATLISNGADKEAAQKALVQAESAAQLAEKRAAASTIVTLNPAPTLDVVTSVELDTGSASYDLSFTMSDEDATAQDKSADVQYIARVEDSEVVTLTADKKSVVTSKEIPLSINLIKAGSTKIYLAPLDNEGKVGEEKEVVISVSDTSVETTSLEVSLSTTSHTFNSTAGVPDEKKLDISLAISDDNGDGELKELSVVSQDTDVVKVEYSATTITLFPVYNGTTTVTVNAVDTNNNVTTKTIDVVVKDVSLPPILGYKDETIKVVKNPNEALSFTFEYDIEDPEVTDTPTLKSVTASVDGITCSDANNDGIAECSVAATVTKGSYTLSSIPTDGLLDGNSKIISLELFEGNVAPELALISGPTLNLETMKSTDIVYKATDLNSEDILTITATSSDESLVTVSVDEVTSTLHLISQPKVGTATISVVASDGELSSVTRTLELTTINELGTLVPTLRVVPILNSDETLFDTRYEMTNFEPSYDILTNTIIINGDVNSTYNFVDFKLNADVELSQFGGVDEDGKYALVADLSLKREGEDFEARVLGFTTEENTTFPYTWALATPEEICNAYSEDTVSLINSYNKNVVDCTTQSEDK